MTNLATKTTLNAKINEVKGEIPNITNLVTDFDNKIKKVSSNKNELNELIWYS